MAPRPGMGSHTTLLAAALCSWGVATVVTACGATNADLERKLDAGRDRTRQLLSSEDVQDQPAGSPQRALVEAWRALQFRDAEAVLARVTGPSVRPRPGLDQRVVAFGAYAVDVRPKILDASLERRRASLRVQLARRQGVGSDGLRIVRLTLTLPVRFIAGRWRVEVDDGLLRRLRRAATG
jgi:hypothetical protein